MGAWNGPLWIPAWQLHDRDPTLIMWKVLPNFHYNFVVPFSYCIILFRLCITTWVVQPSDATTWPGFMFSLEKKWECSLINKYPLKIIPSFLILLKFIFFPICPMMLVIGFTHTPISGSRGDHEKCDVSNTSSEACSKEAVRLYRRGNAKLPKSIWLSRKSSQEITQNFVYWENKVLSELSCLRVWLKKERGSSPQSPLTKTMGSNLSVNL